MTIEELPQSLAQMIPNLANTGRDSISSTTDRTPYIRGVKRNSESLSAKTAQVVGGAKLSDVFEVSIRKGTPQ